MAIRGTAHRQMAMITHRQLLPIIIGLLVLAGAMPAAIAAAPDASMAAPSHGAAGVWFLRPESSTIGAYGATPMIYANGIPIGTLPVNNKFYRDFAAGTYRFTVERYGIPTDEAVTAQLTPGTQTYLEVQWLPTWEMGYAGKTHSFFILGMSAQIAQVWLPSLTYAGQR
jgi:hypothetical protein